MLSSVRCNTSTNSIPPQYKPKINISLTSNRLSLEFKSKFSIFNMILRYNFPLGTVGVKCIYVY